MLALRLRSLLQRGSFVELSTTQREALAEFSAAIRAGHFTFEDVPCLCGARTDHIIAYKDRYALTVVTRLCKKCGIMRTSPRINGAGLASFYDTFYRRIYAGDAIPSEALFAEQVAHGARILQFVKQATADCDLRLVFDIGCGAGGTLLPFASAGCRVAGCDLGSSYLSRGQAAGLDLRLGDVSSLTNMGEADLVILSHVLEHFPDPHAELCRIATTITPNGLLYVELPGIFEIHRTYGDAMLFLQNAHLYHFTLATLATLLSSVGFELVNGNEGIQALFRKTGVRQDMPNRRIFRQILGYLWFSEFVRICRSNAILLTACRAAARLFPAFSVPRDSQRLNISGGQ